MRPSVVVKAPPTFFNWPTGTLNFADAARASMSCMQAAARRIWSAMLRADVDPPVPCMPRTRRILSKVQTTDMLQRAFVGLVEWQAVEQHDRIGVARFDRRRDGPHCLEGQLQTFGGEHDGERINALPHVLMRHGHLDPAIAREFQPGAETRLALARRQRIAVDGAEPPGDDARPDQHAAADDARADQKAAPRDAADGRPAHRSSCGPFAGLGDAPLKGSSA